MDPLPVLVGLRRTGATWEQIGRAAGISASRRHERGPAHVAAVLEPR